ncbi:HNH endonuclease signature motif containing protein [Corynebacterium phoceense]|nr:HNH endonuclease signature motif containing protein [Corynebacterium phoceense]
MGRSTRTATLEQRLALAASELVCSGRGCDTPLVMSDIHHIVAFANGGRTDIENLTIACRP